ncbi:Protein of unknown function [Pyronema omphalodes CBS 100304]|uniref:Uncharacterized protein n=1 Tax=Pyronema omphalodes (strain CBS 100304) TaxID=1076935 RepID=U4LD37_PYROM|nr:Protein of unknown function [Pyronema omphalodes CBS 100304]
MQHATQEPFNLEPSTILPETINYPHDPLLELVLYRTFTTSIAHRDNIILIHNHLSKLHTNLHSILEYLLSITMTHSSCKPSPISVTLKSD